MGRSAGPGSPITFMCFKLRRGVFYEDRTARRAAEHVTTPTGRTKPYRSGPTHALGTRSQALSFEYTCTCGHAGWSNHNDLARRAVKLFPEQFDVQPGYRVVRRQGG